jgi:hypothetical protein
MHLNTFARAALRLAVALLVWSIAFAQSRPRFDGDWLTKVTCPAKGNTEGYTWQFPSVIRNGNFAESAAQPGSPATCRSKARLRRTAAPGYRQRA